VADPVRTGYAFDGWYYDDYSFNNPFNFGANMTSSQTAHAKWIVGNYTIKWVD
jgi:uncharacterized repeat protein (TIGR02543 family)